MDFKIFTAHVDDVERLEKEVQHWLNSHPENVWDNEITTGFNERRIVITILSK